MEASKKNSAGAQGQSARSQIGIQGPSINYGLPVFHAPTRSLPRITRSNTRLTVSEGGPVSDRLIQTFLPLSVHEQAETTGKPYYLALILRILCTLPVNTFAI